MQELARFCVMYVRTWRRHILAKIPMGAAKNEKQVRAVLLSEVQHQRCLRASTLSVSKPTFGVQVLVAPNKAVRITHNTDQGGRHTVNYRRSLVRHVRPHVTSHDVTITIGHSCWTPQ